MTPEKPNYARLIDAAFPYGQVRERMRAAWLPKVAA